MHMIQCCVVDLSAKKHPTCAAQFGISILDGQILLEALCFGTPRTPKVFGKGPQNDLQCDGISI